MRAGARPTAHDRDTSGGCRHVKWRYFGTELERRARRYGGPNGIRPSGC